MDQNAILARLADLLEHKADGLYGLEAVTQKQHALQGATLAERQGAPDALVVATLLHDIGHLVHDLGENPAAEGIDDRHEDLGAVVLAKWFGPDVSEPVRLHVAAKRYLVAVEPDYAARLAPDSVLSLSLQGGPMTPEEAATFRAGPHAASAIALRRLDEAAKDPAMETPGVQHFLPAIARCLAARHG